MDLPTTVRKNTHSRVPPPMAFLAISNAPPVYANVEELRAASNFGEFGGRYIPETLVAAHDELERVYVECTQDPTFVAELEQLGRDYIGRPTPLYFAKRLTERGGGAQIWLKREEVAFTGSHKINNALGQTLVAKRIGKPRVIAETGAGQHGVATATACALLSEWLSGGILIASGLFFFSGDDAITFYSRFFSSIRNTSHPSLPLFLLLADLECVVYMGADDVERQSLNVFRMKMCVSYLQLSTLMRGAAS